MARLPESAARRGAGAAGVSVVSVSGVVRWLLKQKGGRRAHCAVLRALRGGSRVPDCFVPRAAEGAEEPLSPPALQFDLFKLRGGLETAFHKL